MILIDGKKLGQEILSEVKDAVVALNFQPIFCDVLVGDDSASRQYVRMKAKTAERVGIHFHNAAYPASITTEELIKEIKKLNEIENMCGIIVQLPLPELLDARRVLDSIDPKLDVDCLGAIRSDKFYNGDFSLGFPTALACMAILDSLNLNLKTKKITVVGQGSLVGKPVTKLLESRGLTVNIVTRKTENKEIIFKESDVVISGTGQGKLINGNMIKDGAILIDAGTSEAVSGSPGARRGIVGDVDLESVKGIAGFVSPVPGGVGPVTVAMLLRNVLTVAMDLKK